MPRLTVAEARHIVESLRTGVPPKGHVRDFTVGRLSEIQQLRDALVRDARGALLLLANYGAGKSHLLRLVQEEALSIGYAVSWVTVAANSGVRFNRMDQVLGAVWRGLEVPGGLAGPRGFLDTLLHQAECAKTNPASHPFWAKVTSQWVWDYSATLASPGLFVCLRAWATGNRVAQDLVDDFLQQPWLYKSQRKRLYESLVLGLRRFFRDPRPDWHFYRDSVFDMSVAGYAQAWAMLRDMAELARQADLRGLVLLFDEYEDVITNLKNIAYQQAAFWNLFQFFRGDDFKDPSFFAVTPQFAQKCKEVLVRRAVTDYDFRQFDRLPTFSMTPLTRAAVSELATRIVQVHGLAYGWEPTAQQVNGSVKHAIDMAFSRPLEDRTRSAIVNIVKALDEHVESD